MLCLSVVTIFLNAFLIFLIQPIFAKMMLPFLGGSPAVWTTCMLFFQAALLAGYVYSDVSVRLLGVRWQAALHMVVAWFPLFSLPLSTPHDMPGSETAPVPWLIGIMF